MQQSSFLLERGLFRSEKGNVLANEGRQPKWSCDENFLIHKAMKSEGAYAWKEIPAAKATAVLEKILSYDPQFKRNKLAVDGQIRELQSWMNCGLLSHKLGIDDEKTKEIKEGTVLRVDPGFSCFFRGVEYCKAGDIGTVTSLYIDLTRSGEEERFKVFWSRTGKTTNCPTRTWMKALSVLSPEEHKLTEELEVKENYIKQLEKHTEELEVKKNYIKQLAKHTEQLEEHTEELEKKIATLQSTSRAIPSITSSAKKRALADTPDPPVKIAKTGMVSSPGGPL